MRHKHWHAKGALHGSEDVERAPEQNHQAAQAVQIQSCPAHQGTKPWYGRGRRR
jgi:hypothetical protein